MDNKSKKGLRKAFEEIGKHLLNIGVAIIVFAILQPIIKDKFDIKIALSFGIIYLIIFTIAVILIAIGGNNDE